jgi:hypothetical protein
VLIDKPDARRMGSFLIPALDTISARFFIDRSDLGIAELKVAVTSIAKSLRVFFGPALRSLIEPQSCLQISD